MSNKSEEFGQAPNEPHDEYGRPVSKYFSFYVEGDYKDDKLSLTGDGFVVVSEELENLVDVFFPDGEETIVPTDTENYPDEEITLSEIRTDLMRYLDGRANRES